MDTLFTDSWRLDGPGLLVDPETLVRPGDVGGNPAWQDLHRRGMVVEVFSDVGIRPQEPLTPPLRAGALSGHVPARTVVAGLTAAWVWGTAERPARIDLICPRGVHRPPANRLRRARQAAILRSEITELDGVLVTSPLRTVLDVATRTDLDQARAVLTAFARRHEVDLHDAARSLELRYRWSGREHARAVLAAVR